MANRAAILLVVQIGLAGCSTDDYHYPAGGSVGVVFRTTGGWSRGLVYVYSIGRLRILEPTSMIEVAGAVDPFACVEQWCETGRVHWDTQVEAAQREEIDRSLNEVIDCNLRESYRSDRGMDGPRLVIDLLIPTEERRRIEIDGGGPLEISHLLIAFNRALPKTYQLPKL